MIQSDRANVGYIDDIRVIARLDGSYRLNTPVGYLAVGKDAETHGVKTVLASAKASPAPRKDTP